MSLARNNHTLLASYSDEDLLRLADNSSECLLELYDRYFPAAYSLAVRMLSDSAQAEALAQRVFLQLRRTWHSGEAARGDFSTWLLTSVQRAAHEKQKTIRQRCHHPQNGANIDDPALHCATHQANEPALSRPGARQVAAEASIALLLPAERAALELAYFDCMTTTEIAAALRVSPAVTTDLIRTGMEKLCAGDVAGQPPTESAPGDAREG